MDSISADEQTALHCQGGAGWLVRPTDPLLKGGHIPLFGSYTRSVLLWKKSIQFKCAEQCVTSNQALKGVGMTQHRGVRHRRKELQMALSA